MNENRSVFALDGITGMLIATVLLLVILGVLSTLSFNIQNANASKFYEIKDEQKIRMNSSDNAAHRVIK